MNRIHTCVGEIDKWMSSNRLKLNADTTEFICLGTRHQLAKVSLTWLVIGDQSIIADAELCDVGVIIDDELTMESHVANVVVRNCFYLAAPSAVHCSAVIDPGHWSLRSLRVALTTATMSRTEPRRNSCDDSRRYTERRCSYGDRLWQVRAHHTSSPRYPTLAAGTSANTV